MSQVSNSGMHAPEMAPSDLQTEQPTLSRLAGSLGLLLLVAGVVTVIARQYGAGLFSEEIGYLFGMLGLTGLLVHAARDSDLEVRRLYGVFAAALLIAAVVVSLIPVKVDGSAERKVGALFFPWGAGAGFLSLLFFIPFARYETEEPYRRMVERILFGVGVLLTVGAVLSGIVTPDFLIGPGVVLALLGLGFLSAYLGQTDTTVGLGWQTAVGLGILGVIAIVIALGRSIVPTVLHEGPAALKTAAQTYDWWKVAARVLFVLVGLGLAAVALRRDVAPWLRGVLGVLGLAIAGVFIVGSFSAPMHTAPAPYLVPHGLVLCAIGIVYLAVSLGTCTDSPFIVMTRRELAAYFYSPIAYIVLFGMAFFAALGYMFFISRLGYLSGLSMRSTQEPIVQSYMSFGILGAFQATFLVPALTMRLFSEEKRTGTLEVLLTAPVNEATVVLSKFVACWIFFMICWLPAGLYLIALRAAGGPFDYRPLLSLYLALACSGAAFVSMGLFFSSLTRNQIVAGVLTFSGMMFLLLTILATEFGVLGSGLQTALSRFDFLTLWQNSLLGQLSVTAILIQLSMAAFWLFLTTKIVEARKWA